MHSAMKNFTIVPTERNHCPGARKQALRFHRRDIMTLPSISPIISPPQSPSSIGDSCTVDVLSLPTVSYSPTAPASPTSHQYPLVCDPTKSSKSTTMKGSATDHQPIIPSPASPTASASSSEFDSYAEQMFFNKSVTLALAKRVGPSAGKQPHTDIPLLSSTISSVNHCDYLNRSIIPSRNNSSPVSQKNKNNTLFKNSLRDSKVLSPLCRDGSYDTTCSNRSNKVKLSNVANDDILCNDTLVQPQTYININSIDYGEEDKSSPTLVKIPLRDDSCYLPIKFNKSTQQIKETPYTHITNHSTVLKNHLQKLSGMHILKNKVNLIEQETNIHLTLNNKEKINIAQETLATNDMFNCSAATTFTYANNLEVDQKSTYLLMHSTTPQEQPLVQSETFTKKHGKHKHVQSIKQNSMAEIRNMREGIIGRVKLSNVAATSESKYKIPDKSYQAASEHNISSENLPNNYFTSTNKYHGLAENNFDTIPPLETHCNKNPNPNHTESAINSSICDIMRSKPVKKVWKIVRESSKIASVHDLKIICSRASSSTSAITEIKENDLQENKKLSAFCQAPVQHRSHMCSETLNIVAPTSSTVDVFQLNPKKNDGKLNKLSTDDGLP